MSRTTCSIKTAAMLAVIGALLLAACAPSAARDSAVRANADASNGQGQLKVEFVGQLESLSARSARVDGARLVVDEHTLVAPGVAANQIVHAATVLRAGDLAALSIEPAAPGQAAGQSFELTGVLESQAGTVWTIGGQAVQVGAAAEIKGNPAIGSTVKAQGTLSAAGSLVAREVKALAADGATPEASETHEADDDQDEAEATETPEPQKEFTGTVTSIATDMWSIDGAMVRVTGKTEIEGDPREGDVVKVEARAGTDGVLTAEEIKLVTSTDEHAGMGDDQDEHSGIDDQNEGGEHSGIDDHSGDDSHGGSPDSTIGSDDDGDHSGSGGGGHDDGGDGGGEHDGGGDD